MTWLYVLDGMSANIQFNEKTDDIEEIVDSIESDKGYRTFEKKVEAEGLKLVNGINYDDWSVSIMLGVELHKDRHIYQGQTITCYVSKFNEELRTQLESELELLLVNIVKREFTVKRGIVIHNFD